MKLRLWERDDRILKECSLNPHSLSQITMSHFSTRKKASERMKKLYDFGLLNRFPGFSPHAQGKAEYIYIISKKGQKLLDGWSLEDLSVNNNPNNNFDFRSENIGHSLQINHFRIILEQSFQADKTIIPTFLYKRQFTRQGLDECSLRPDAAFVLKNVKLKKCLLHFLEIDTGSEAIQPGIRNTYSLSGKLRKYLQYFDSDYYRSDFNELFKTDFKGFRLMLVANSKRRTDSIINLGREQDVNFLWVTEFENISKDRFASAIWQTMGGNRIPLISEREKNGDLVGDLPGEIVPGVLSEKAGLISDLRTRKGGV